MAADDNEQTARSSADNAEEVHVAPIEDMNGVEIPEE